MPSIRSPNHAETGLHSACARYTTNEQALCDACRSKTRLRSANKKYGFTSLAPVCEHNCVETTLDSSQFVATKHGTEGGEGINGCRRNPAKLLAEQPMAIRRAAPHVGASDWEIVQQCLAREIDIRYSMHVPSSHPAVKDRVIAVNAMFCSTLGERRLFLDPRCDELRKDLQQVVWKADVAGNITGDIYKSDRRRTLPAGCRSGKRSL